ncbi:MAG TPA: hypothetical protein VGE65_04960 [Sphingobium sp.]
MILRRPVIAAAALALAGMSGVALAQAKPKPAAPAARAPTPATNLPPSLQPTKEQIEEAAFQMRVLVAGMNSDKVEAPVKDALFECLYQNSFSKISDGIGKVIAGNPGKINKRDPEQVLGVMAGICGYRPKPDAAAAPATPAPTPTTPAKPGDKPLGR